MNQQLSGDCQKPGCERNASETYRGENDNTLRLCEKCYYRLVSGSSSPTGIGTADPLVTGTEPHQIELEDSAGDRAVSDHSHLEDLKPPEESERARPTSISDLLDDDALHRPPSPDEPFWTLTVSPRPL